MTNYDSTPEKRTVPYGATTLAVDTNGHTHYFAPAVKDRRVFIAADDTVLETHDLDNLVREGVLADATPRAWVEAFDRDCAGFDTIHLGESLVDQLAAAFDREATA